eukprot:825775_1
MRGIRRPNARDKVFNKQTKSHSSLSSLPCTNSKNNHIKSKYKRNSTKSIQKTSIKRKKYNKQEEKDKEEYDSTDSLDQLLDNSFLPNKKKIQSNHSPKHSTPRKSIKSSAGNKRSKAMALMASNMKQKKKHSYNNRYSYKKDAKKEYENIRKNELKYKTPSVNNNKIHSNFTSLRKSRKIITPINNNNNNNNISYINALDINQTPKASNTLKGLPTPSTQTPVKLIKYLNVKTPQTVHNNDNEKCVKRKLSLRFDDNNILQNDKNKTTEIEINSALKRTNKQIDTKSWKDIAYTPRDDNGNKSWKDMDYKCDKNQNKNDSNELSEFDKLILCTRRLQLPLKFLGLLQKFNALESTLALYMRKNNFFVHLGNIERSVQQITKKRFTTNDFQQILHIMPEFYHVQWTAYVNKGAGITKKELRITVTGMDRKYDDLGLNNNDYENITKKKGGKSIDIGLKFLKVSKLRERENIFRLKLYEYIREEHKQYLIDNILIEFDPFISGNWHRNFDLENMKNIAMNLLPRKPIKNRNEMEKMVNDQNEQLEYIMEKEIEIIKKQKENN